MDKLLIDLCCRLPYHPKGRLENGDGGVNGVLVGISFEDSLKPAVYVQVKGFKAPWTCDYTMFKPYLKPLFPTIYEKQEDGLVPWLEFKKRWYNESPVLNGKAGSEFLENLESWEFKKADSKYDRWWQFEGKMKDNKTLFETATFHHHLAYEVGYEMGIDMNGLLETDQAILWTP